MQEQWRLGRLVAVWLTPKALTLLARDMFFQAGPNV
jgi:hypothetical protein